MSGPRRLSWETTWETIEPTPQYRGVWTATANSKLIVDGSERFPNIDLVDGKEYGRGSGKSKNAAMDQAAEKALEALE